MFLTQLWWLRGRPVGTTRHVWTKDARTSPYLVLRNAAGNAMAMGCVTVTRIVTVIWDGRLLTADILEPEAVWTVGLHESPKNLILRGSLCWSSSCLCCRSHCCLLHSGIHAVAEALCTSATPLLTRAARAELLPLSLLMLEMEIKYSRSDTSGPARVTFLSPRLSARILSPPNLQFPRSHCLWIPRLTLLHSHYRGIQHLLLHLHHPLTHIAQHQPLLLPDLLPIHLYGDSSTPGNSVLRPSMAYKEHCVKQTCAKFALTQTSTA